MNRSDQSELGRAVKVELSVTNKNKMSKTNIKVGVGVDESNKSRAVEINKCKVCGVNIEVGKKANVRTSAKTDSSINSNGDCKVTD